MGAYLQLGHVSWNLLDEQDLGAYHGAVVSPVNDDPASVRNRIAQIARRNEDLVLEYIFDPQLYNPASDRGQLSEWRYFPRDFETANRSDPRWWANVARGMVDEAAGLGLNAVCSPAEVPSRWSDEYFQFAAGIADQTKAAADAAGLDTLMTVIIRLRELANPRRALDIASILTASRCDRIYLTFLVEDHEQRAPIVEPDSLPTAVHLVRLLSRDMRVHVAFAAHDMVLWKHAGATDASSGKFLNLRRFSPGRWMEDEGGIKQQNQYWNESRLLTLLREQDVARLRREGWYEGRTFANNPAGSRIFEIMTSGEARAWVQQSWVQYLRWFSNAEGRLRSPGEAEQLLEIADRAWGGLQTRRPPILFADRFNTGDHVRTWLNAAREGGAR
jgi:hypothetical protein